jgi:hypothetical protein
VFVHQNHDSCMIPTTNSEPYNPSKFELPKAQLQSLYDTADNGVKRAVCFQMLS